MTKRAKREDGVRYDLNMSVAVMAKIPQDIAYWCCPAKQETGPTKGKLVTYLWADGTGFKLPEKFKFRLDYPFDRAYEEEWDPTRKVTWKGHDGKEQVQYHRFDSIGDLVWAAAQAYQRAFKWANDNEVGYWHSIGDLVFEGVTIYPDGTVEFSVGS